MNPANNITRDEWGWRLDHSYARLPQEFYRRIDPVTVRAPETVLVNTDLAVELGLAVERWTDADWAAVGSGNTVPAGAQPIAQAYAGHQFGHFTMLGDGRALIMGEQLDPNGRRWDVQWKGSGQTAFSRNGDGRAALAPMLREYVISEAMAALGIPTTRSLSVVTTGEPVFRETPLPGAVLLRVAASHIRVGTFQYAAGCGGEPLVRKLATYTWERHFAEAATPPDADELGMRLLKAVIERQARLIAQWMSVGFIHGVMNTDNMALSGETIDYGPCAFMDTYDPETVFSSIDRHGRYAFGAQPQIAQWNLARFAETLLPLLHPDQEQAIPLAEEALSDFASRYHEEWMALMRRKLGWAGEQADDVGLIQDLLTWMLKERADYTNSFCELIQYAAGDRAACTGWPEEWLTRWAQRAAWDTDAASSARVATMKQANPAVIPRNFKVEHALTTAQDHQDMAPFHTLLKILKRPFAHGEVPPDYAQPWPESAGQYQTFCGT